MPADDLPRDFLSQARADQADGYSGPTVADHKSGPDADICRYFRGQFPALAGYFPDDLQAQLLGYHWVPGAEPRDLQDLAMRHLATAMVYLYAARDQAGLLKRTDDEARARYQSTGILARKVGDEATAHVKLTGRLRNG